MRTDKVIKVVIDKNNGNILYAPILPNPIYAHKRDQIKYLKALDYILENGVAEEEYNEFEAWKKQLSTINGNTEKSWEDWENYKRRKYGKISNIDMNIWDW